MVLRTNEIDWAWLGDMPMYISRVALGGHFGTELLFYNVVEGEDGTSKGMVEAYCRREV